VPQLSPIHDDAEPDVQDGDRDDARDRGGDELRWYAPARRGARLERGEPDAESLECSDRHELVDRGVAVAAEAVAGRRVRRSGQAQVSCFRL
jgi:hypothetical protein